MWLWVSGTRSRKRNKSLSERDGNTISLRQGHFTKSKNPDARPDPCGTLTLWLCTISIINISKVQRPHELCYLFLGSRSRVCVLGSCLLTLTSILVSRLLLSLVYYLHCCDTPTHSADTAQNLTDECRVHAVAQTRHSGLSQLGNPNQNPIELTRKAGTPPAAEYSTSPRRALCRHPPASRGAPAGAAEPA